MCNFSTFARIYYPIYQCQRYNVLTGICYRDVTPTQMHLNIHSIKHAFGNYVLHVCCETSTCAACSHVTLSVIPAPARLVRMSRFLWYQHLRGLFARHGFCDTSTYAACSHVTVAVKLALTWFVRPFPPLFRCRSFLFAQFASLQFIQLA